MTNCTIRWLNQPTTIGKEYFQKVNNTNILQDPTYGLAITRIQSQILRCAVLEIEGKEAGFMQVLEAKVLGTLLHAVILDRGPVWFDGYGSEQDFESFLNAFNHEFPRRLGRRIRLIPEVANSENIENMLKKAKFSKKSEGYQTLTIDLTQSEEALHENLKKKWRGPLQKAEKSNLRIDWTHNEQLLEWFLKFYCFDKKTKGYDGPAVKLIRELAKAFAQDEKIHLGRALVENRAIAAILVFSHGRGATYQIGWNTQDGRKYGAHNFLLWNAMLRLKSQGITTFDLGGVNDTQAKNVKTFKEGMGGKLLTLPGLYT